MPGRTGPKGPRNALLFFFLLPAAASGHAISMSSGFVTVTGNRVEYLLRMPAYEVAPSAGPRALLDHIRFTSGFETARRTGGECREDAATATYVCAANYEFSGPVEKLGVECTFYQVTVPNHIQMLRAEKDGKHDQAILDSSFPSATLAFRPPTAVEQAVDQSAAGAVRVWSDMTQLLLLIALSLAARTPREFVVLFLAFLAGEWGGAAILAQTFWQPPLRFAEAAVALALAYLSLEILAFPKSGGRWMLALVFGAFESLFFVLFIADSGYRQAWVITGASFAALSAGAICALAGFVIFRVIPRETYRTALRKAAVCALGITGVIWFMLRLKS